MNNADIISKYAYVAPILNQIYIEDVAVSVCNLEGCVCYIPGLKINHNLKSGTPHVLNSSMYKSIKEKRRIVGKVPKDVFGFPYIGVSMPIVNDCGDVIGGIGLYTSTERHDKLLGLATQLSSAVDSASKSTMELSLASDQIHSSSVELSSDSKSNFAEIENTENVLNLINSFAKKSTLLGLNAMIESSRLGELGRGFGIVAEEIGKLAKSSNDSISHITKSLSSLKASSNSMNEEIERITSLLKKHSDSTRNIVEILENIKDLSEELRDESRVMGE